MNLGLIPRRQQVAHLRFSEYEHIHPKRRKEGQRNGRKEEERKEKRKEGGREERKKKEGPIGTKREETGTPDWVPVPPAVLPCPTLVGVAGPALLSLQGQLSQVSSTPAAQDRIRGWSQRPRCEQLQGPLPQLPATEAGATAMGFPALEGS